MQDEDTPPRRWRLRTKIFLTFGTVVAAVILALIVIPKKQYALLLSEKLVAQARAAGINVVISEPELRLRGFSARQISIFVPKILSTFNLTEVQVEMSALALFTGTFRVAASGNIFGGSLSAAVNRALSGGDVTVSVNAESLRLASAPQFQAFGVESGTLSLQLKEVLLSDQTGLKGGSWSLGVDGLTKKEDTFIQLPPKAGGGFIAIPAVQNMKLAATGRLSATEVTVDNATTESSLGKADMHGSVGIASAGLIALSGSATLSPESQKKFGPFLPMASNNLVPASASRLSLLLNGTMRRPQFIIRPP